MDIEKVIRETFLEVLEQTGSELIVPDLVRETVLLESGLDSLGFAMLVAFLDEKLEYDPFSMMDEPFYPMLFGEFIDLYVKMNPNK